MTVLCPGPGERGPGLPAERFGRTKKPNISRYRWYKQNSTGLYYLEILIFLKDNRVMKLTLRGISLVALTAMVWILPASAGTVAISPGCGAEGVTGVPAGGLVCTVSAMGQTLTTPLTTDIAGLSSAQTVVISYLAGSVNLNSPWEDFLFNPDGSLVNPNSTSSWSVGNLDYSYLKPGAQNYPTDFGGNGVNQLAGGGTNYDEFPGANCAWGFWTEN